MGARGRTIGSTLLVVAALTACGREQPTVSASDEEPTAAPVEDEPAPAAAGGGPDLDGDGRADSVTLLEVPDTGWSFDVRLADGRQTSAPLPDDGVVRGDVEVVGPVDLGRDVPRDDLALDAGRAHGRAARRRP